MSCLCMHEYIVNFKCWIISDQTTALKIKYILECRTHTWRSGHFEACSSWTVFKTFLLLKCIKLVYNDHGYNDHGYNDHGYNEFTATTN